MLQSIWAFLAIPFGFILKICYQFANDVLHLPFAFMFALIFFALITNIPFFPLALRQQRFAVIASVYKPMIDEINSKYSSNRKKQYEELERLENEFGYKKASGALLYLVQFPIIFGLIEVINKPLSYMLGISKELLGELSNITATVITDVTGLSAAEAAQQISITSSSRGIESSVIELIKSNIGAFSGLTATNPEWSAEIQKIANLKLSIGSFNLLSLFDFNKFSVALFPIILLLITAASSLFSMLNSQGFHERNSMRSGILTMIATGAIFLFLSIIYPIGFSVYWATVCIYLIVQSFVLKKACNSERIIHEQEEKLKEKKQKEEDARKLKVTENDGTERYIELSEEELADLRLKRSREIDSLRYEEDDDVGESDG